MACQAATHAVWPLFWVLSPVIESVRKIRCLTSSNFDWTTCLGTITQQEPIINDQVRIKLIDQDYICGLYLKVCDSDWMVEDFDAWRTLILNDKPVPKEPVPSGKATYKILQLNDIHSDDLYKEGTSIDCSSSTYCCQNSFPHPKGPLDSAGYWGSPYSLCDIPHRTYEGAMNWINKNIQVDYAILLGDVTNHSQGEMGETRRQSFTKYVADVIRKTWGPKWPTFPIIGNHELYPIDQYDNYLDSLSPHLVKTAGLWEGVATPEVLEQLKTKGYYAYSLPGRKVKFVNIFVGLDDDFNMYNFKMDWDPTAQFEWLYNTLKESESKGEGVFILKHIPLGSTIGESVSKHLLVILDRFANTLRGVFAAHTHADEVSFVRDGEGGFIAPQFVGASLTTYQWGSHPSFRVYTVDSESHTVVDLETWVLDLDKANQHPTADYEVTFEKFYSFKDAYGLQDLSFGTWEAVDKKRQA